MIASPKDRPPGAIVFGLIFLALAVWGICNKYLYPKQYDPEYMPSEEENYINVGWYQAAAALEQDGSHITVELLGERFGEVKSAYQTPSPGAIPTTVTKISEELSPSELEPTGEKLEIDIGNASIFEGQLLYIWFVDGQPAHVEILKDVADYTSGF